MCFNKPFEFAFQNRIHNNLYHRGHHQDKRSGIHPYTVHLSKGCLELAGFHRCVISVSCEQDHNLKIYMLYEKKTYT